MPDPKRDPVCLDPEARTLTKQTIQQYEDCYERLSQVNSFAATRVHYIIEAAFEYQHVRNN